jgi:putative ABC transport system substrate-binding protein
MPVIGYLHSQRADALAFRVEYFLQGLKEEGFTDGRNVRIEYRWANNQLDLLPDLAMDLVRRRVSVIIAPDGSTSPLVLKSVTSTIPIVFVMGADPIQRGLVASLSHPGGNFTGVTTILLDVGGKRLELLSQLVPQATTIALLIESRSPSIAQEEEQMNAAARALGRKIVIVRAHEESELEGAFATMVEKGATALVINQGVEFTNSRDKIIGLAARHRIPAIYPFRQYVADGGLMSYGGADKEAHRLSGIYVGRILKGEKPADLPVQQSTKFEFVINVTNAKALGLTVPPSLLALADEVIE